jgi:hypothetical protein
MNNTKNIKRRTFKVGQHHQILLMEGITPQAMLTTKQYNPSHIQYNDTHVYLYFLMSIPRGLMLTIPYYYILSF